MCVGGCGGGCGYVCGGVWGCMCVCNTFNWSVLPLVNLKNSKKISGAVGLLVVGFILIGALNKHAPLDF